MQSAPFYCRVQQATEVGLSDDFCFAVLKGCEQAPLLGDCVSAEEGGG